MDQEKNLALQNLYQDGLFSSKAFEEAKPILLFYKIALYDYAGVLGQSVKK